MAVGQITGTSKAVRQMKSATGWKKPELRPASRVAIWHIVESASASAQSRGGPPLAGGRRLLGGRMARKLDLHESAEIFLP